MIVCGWCHADTELDRCSACGRDPSVPWLQRAMEPPTVDPTERNRRRLASASAEIRAGDLEPTAERLAERLDVSVRTVRRWQADVTRGS